MRDRLFAALELVGDAFREIRVHPLRSLLTLFGIVFGAASLVSMVSLAGAMKEMTYHDMYQIGMPRSFSIRNDPPSPDARSATERKVSGLRFADLTALAELPGVESVLGSNGAGQRVIGGPSGRITVPVEGVDAGYTELRNMRIREGRSLRPLDIRNQARVAVVGSEIVSELFGTTPPLGRTLTMDGTRFLVVGVVEPIPVMFIPADFSFIARRIYIPYTYLTRYARESSRVDAAFVTVRTEAGVGPGLAASTRLIERRHGTADFEIQNEAAEVAENLVMADNILGGWNVVMFAIGGITLFVGGIGLFSVLLISVRERVREVGVRKALGADDRDILQLFLVESLTLAAMGAVLGIAGGAGLVILTEFIASRFGKIFTVSINLPAVVISFVFALLAGLVFGYYPARRAARLDPIEAISEL